MAGSGSENRRRQIVLKARFTDEEATRLKASADRTGVSVAALIRHAVLNEKPLRASRQPPADRKEICRLIGALGSFAQALRDAGKRPVAPQAIEAMQRDVADILIAAFEALGRRS